MPEPTTGIPTSIDRRKVKVVAFYTACTFLITLLAAWGSSLEISWLQALKAASLAAAGYAGGKLHR